MYNFVMAVLYIDTSNSEEISIELENAGKKFKETASSKVLKSQALLPLIEKTLKENNFSVSDISEIRVNPGPGSFTGLRVGVSVANVLGWTLGIPVNGYDVTQQPAEPKYE